MKKYEFILNDDGFECTVIARGSSMQDAIEDLEVTFDSKFIVSARIIEE